MAPTIPQPPPQSLLQTHCTFATNEFEARPIINEHEALGTRKEEEKVCLSSCALRFLLCAPIF